MAVNICSTTSGAKPSDGSSSIRTLGRAIRPRADREHLLLAAGELPGELAGLLLEDREEVVDLVRRLGPLLLESRCPPTSRLSRTLTPAKSWRPAGTRTRPALHRSQALDACLVRTHDGDRALLAGQVAGQAGQQARLAGAVEAEQADDGPGRDGEGTESTTLSAPRRTERS